MYHLPRTKAELVAFITETCGIERRSDRIDLGRRGLKRLFLYHHRGYDGGIEMEARSQIGGHGAAAAGTATESRHGPIRRAQQSRAHFSEAAVAGERQLP